MTTLYRPVLIETAEQAEALPVGTIAILRDGTRIRRTLTRTDSLLGPWEMDMRGYRHASVLGFTALVSIEAEEETTRLLHLDGRMDGYTFEAGDELPEWCFDGPPRTRYVTGWAEVGQ